MVSYINLAQQKAARIAGIAYLFSFAVIVFSNFAIYNRLEVEGNAVETAKNILSNETSFRISIALDLLYAAGLATVLAALYTILKPVDRNLAVLATILKLLYVIAWVLMALKL